MKRGINIVFPLLEIVSRHECVYYFTFLYVHAHSCPPSLSRFFFFHLIEDIVDVQCCVSVMFTEEWISYVYTSIHSPPNTQIIMEH